MTPELDELKERIEARHGTVYRFCRKHRELNRATVYMVLRGRYGGNLTRQLRRIRAALDGEVSMEDRAFAAIRRAACARCATVRKDDCTRCNELFRAQARAVATSLSQIE